MTGDTIYTDADLEMIEMAADATELENETCRGCGETYQSVTRYISGPAHRVEVYECVCGHHAVWVGGRRVS
jgi:hypothetical protein